MAILLAFEIEKPPGTVVSLTSIMRCGGSRRELGTVERQESAAPLLS